MEWYHLIKLDATSRNHIQIHLLLILVIGSGFLYPVNGQEQGKCFFIDHENGNDRSQGSIQHPWKHHPWDSDAAFTAKSTRGPHTYVFKNGVIYRGSLLAQESGLPAQPIRLISDPAWGNGRPVLMATTQVKGKWRKCNKEQFPELDSDVVDRIWYSPWKTPSEPRTLYQVNGDRIIRLSLAREPDWLPWDGSKGEDVKEDWWESENVFIRLKMSLENPLTLSKAKSVDLIHEGKGRSNTLKARVVSIGKDHVIIELPKNEPFRLRPPMSLICGGKIMQVKCLAETHGIITELSDPEHLARFSVYPESSRKGGTLWAEDLTGSRVLPTPIERFLPEKGMISSNFHYGIEGPSKYSRYFIENLPFLLDQPGEFYFSSKRRMIFLRLKNDQDPNTAHLEAGSENVVLSIKNRSFIDIEGLSFAGSNEIPISEASSDYWRGGLHNSAIQIIGNVSHIGIRGCTFANVPQGIVSFCSNGKETERIEHIQIENNEFKNIGGSAVTLSAISLLRWSILRKGKQGRLRHAVVRGNGVSLAGSRRISLWGFDHALCLEDAELCEVHHNVTYRTAGSGILVKAPPFYNQYGEFPKIVVPVQRNLIHHNHVEDSLLALQDYGGIAYWHGGPAYIYQNSSINPVGYKHTHHRNHTTAGTSCYRSSGYGIGIYADHGYKVYAFDNQILGKNGDCSDRIYNACGWNEAAGFLNSVFNNRISNFSLSTHKGMTESNRCRYIGNTFENTHESHFRIDAKHVEFDTLAFAGNHLMGSSKAVATGFSLGWNAAVQNLPQWQDFLKRKGAISHETGVFIPLPPGSSERRQTDRRRVFVPWGLAYPAGEYHFIPYPKDYSRIVDEHILWDRNWQSRESVRTGTPRNDLTGVNIGAKDFVDGELENWTRGALQLNGRDQFISANSRDLFQPQRNKFVMELFVKAGSAGPLCHKIGQDGKGYGLMILKDGGLGIGFGLARKSWQSARTRNAGLLDGRFHHILVEADGTCPNFFRIYIDGIRKETSPLRDSAVTTGEHAGRFMIGHDGTAYLPCTLEFFRFANGTLTDSETTIEDLYQWQFSGPAMDR